MEIDFPINRRLDRALGITATTTPDDADDRRRKFAQQALDELVEWTLGSWRANTIAELDLRRVSRIFRHVRDEEVPTKTVLVSDFSLPVGRAQSMVTRMKYGDSAWVEGKAINSALDRIRVSKVDQDDWEADGVMLRNRTLSKSVDKTLTTHLTRLYELDPTTVPKPSKEPTPDGFGVTWTMPVTEWADLERILTGIAAEYE